MSVCVCVCACVCVCVHLNKPCSLHVYPQVDSELEIKAYYAGHVLGAAMFLVKVRDQSIVYTVSGLLGALGEG